MFHLLGGLAVEADVQIVYGVYAALLHLFAVAPVLVGADKFAELGAVVAEVVYAHGLVT